MTAPGMSMGMSTGGVELLAATPGHLPHPQHIPPPSTGRQSPTLQAHHHHLATTTTPQDNAMLLKHHSHPLTTAASSEL